MEKLGTCAQCFGICAASFALGLLVYGLGTAIPIAPLAFAGLAGAAVAGGLVLLHAAFFLIRRRDAPKPGGPRFHLGATRPSQAPPRRCCGQ